MPFWKGKSSHTEVGCFVEAGTPQESATSPIGFPNVITPKISVPFHLMTIEELLEALPSCSGSAVTDIWLPEMRKKVATAKQALQAGEERRLESQNLKAIGQQAAVIAKTYRSAMKSAESILERDESGSKDLLSEASQRLQDSEADRAKSQLKAITTQDTFDAVWRVVRPPVVFSLTFPEQWSPTESQAIRQVLRDYPGPLEAPVTPTVRVLQHVYFQAMNDLEQAEKTASALKGVATNQSDIISDQSVRLHTAFIQLVNASKVIEARDHEILLLDRRNEELIESLSDYEVGIRRAEHDQASSEKLIEELQRVAKEADGRVDEKERALFKMRQDLDRMREQLTMSQTKVRDLQGRRAEAVMQRDASRMPASASAFTLGVQRLQRGVVHGTPRPRPTYRIVAPPVNLPVPDQAEIVSINSSNVSESVYGQRLPRPFRLSPALQTPPESHTDTCPPRLIPRRAEFQDKPLPSPPTISPTVPPTALLGRGQISPSEHSDKSVVQLPIRSENDLNLLDAEKRILSSITEASNEIIDSGRTASATSSDKEAYRTSINALNLLDTQTSPQQEHSPLQGMVGVKGRRGLRKFASEEMNVQQLYHHQRKHL